MDNIQESRLVMQVVTYTLSSHAKPVSYFYSRLNNDPKNDLGFSSSAGLLSRLSLSLRLDLGRSPSILSCRLRCSLLPLELAGGASADAAMPDSSIVSAAEALSLSLSLGLADEGDELRFDDGRSPCLELRVPVSSRLRSRG